MNSKAVYAAISLKMAFNWILSTEVIHMKVKFLYFVSVFQKVIKKPNASGINTLDLRMIKAISHFGIEILIVSN
jgi:hypothetical protein